MSCIAHDDCFSEMEPLHEARSGRFTSAPVFSTGKGFCTYSPMFCNASGNVVLKNSSTCSLVFSSSKLANGMKSVVVKLRSRFGRAMSMKELLLKDELSPEIYAALFIDLKSTRELGRELLSTFIRNNWTGPPDIALSNVQEEDRKRCLDLLGDADPAYPLCRTPEHLLVSLALLKCITSKEGALFQDHLLYLKALWIQQQLLEEKSVKLHDAMKEQMEKLEKILPVDYPATDALMEMYLISFNIALSYGEMEKGDKYLTSAVKSSKMIPVLTGILGKRTRFQEKEYAQLVVSFENGASLNSDSPQHSPSLFPHDVPLDDDTLLPQIHLSEAPDVLHLSPAESAALLVCGISLPKRKARSELLEEEVLAFIGSVLKSNPPYSVKASALFHRSKYEAEKMRKTIRAMQQLETLISAFSHPEPSFEGRFAFCLAANLPPIWKVQETYGLILMQNGCSSEAVNIFTNLKSWENVIECYQRIGQLVKAEDLILRELRDRPTPSMWCRLGDIREDESCFEKAWELSKHRSVQSRRQLGRLLVKRKQFDEAVTVLRQGLDVNGLDARLWFTYGYALIKAGKHDEAMNALHRCVHLDPENFMAWNNLGSLALRSGDYPKAFRILQDSIKADYENWNVWDNYQQACHHTKEFEEEIKAFHRLLELRGSVAAEALAGLVQVVTEGTHDVGGSPASRLRPKVKELFGAITAKQTDNFKIWALYGQLQMPETEEAVDDQKKAEVLTSVVQKLQRAHRHSLLSLKNWEKEEFGRINVLSIALDLSKSQLALAELEKDEDNKRVQKASVRLMLDNVIFKVKKGAGDMVSGEMKLDDASRKLFGVITEMRASL